MSTSQTATTFASLTKFVIDSACTRPMRPVPIIPIFIFDDEISELQMCINKQMSELDPYEKMLLTEKIDWGNTYVEISEKYNIPYGSLQSGLKKTLKKIKEKCKHLT